MVLSYPTISTTMQFMESNDLTMVRSVSYSQAVKYVTVASFAIMVFDYCLTFDREITLVWKMKWAPGKILFLLTRYSAFVDVPLTLWGILVGYHSVAPSPSKCLVVYTITTWSGLFGIAMSEAVFFLRTSAIYHGRKLVLIFLVLFYAVILAINLAIIEFFLRSLKFGEDPYGLPGLGGCHIVAGSKVFFLAFCTIIFQETVILFMTLYQGFKTTRFSTSQYMRTFYKDGIFYYVYMLLISASNIIVLVVGPVALLDLFNTFQRVMHSVLATRILLHVREILVTEVLVTDRESRRCPSMLSVQSKATETRPSILIRTDTWSTQAEPSLE